MPHAIRALIQGCLRKDRKERIGDISTALFRHSQPHAVTQSALVAPPPGWRRAMLVVGGVLVGAAIAAAMLWKREPFAESANESNKPVWYTRPSTLCARKWYRQERFESIPPRYREECGSHKQKSTSSCLRQTNALSGFTVRG